MQSAEVKWNVSAVRHGVFLKNQNMEVMSLRCPDCGKLLAKCVVRGAIEIVCPRCHAVVRNTFA